ncbi:MAG: FAD synthetase, partial [Planctomycetia bacterium]|nr:FAD synthetase [Planctomycetia bacterium]
MYAYIHDRETGGLLLTNTITDKSNEPRPVYAKELDILGINKFWKYRRQNDVPYMWAEANKYFYRGDVIFTLSG